jgi:hypothetical protein
MLEQKRLCWVLFSKYLFWQHTYSTYFSDTIPVHQSLLKEIETLSNCTKRAQHRLNVRCSDNLAFHMRYRSYDGHCNHLTRVYQGASLTAFNRVLEPQYEDGYYLPIGEQQFNDIFALTKP